MRHNGLDHWQSANGVAILASMYFLFSMFHFKEGYVRLYKDRLSQKGGAK